MALLAGRQCPQQAERPWLDVRPGMGGCPPGEFAAGLHVELALATVLGSRCSGSKAGFGGHLFKALGIALSHQEHAVVERLEQAFRVHRLVDNTGKPVLRKELYRPPRAEK